MAAYGAPRYSDDLDVVIPADAIEPLAAWLTGEQGFKEFQVPPDLVQNYAGKVGRWANDELTVDLLPGAVRDREAQVDIPERWSTKDPIQERLVLIDTSTRNPVRWSGGKHSGPSNSRPAACVILGTSSASVPATRTLAKSADSTRT